MIYERLRHVPGGQTHAESTQAHMDDYAASGLRTLCLSKRELTKTEYDAWNETVRLAFPKSLTTVCPYNTDTFLAKLNSTRKRRSLWKNGTRKSTRAPR